jgi:hypothetical protein
MSWETLRDGVDGQTVAALLNAGRSGDELSAARDAVASREALQSVLRKEVEILRSSYIASDTQLDSVAAAIASGVDLVEAVSVLERKPGHWMGIPAAWAELAKAYQDPQSLRDRTVVCRSGAVSDCLAFDRERGEYGEQYWEYTVEVLARAALEGGMEAVVLPKTVEGVRLFPAVAPMSRSQLPSSTYLEIDASLVDPAVAESLTRLAGLAVLAARPAHRVALSHRTSPEAFEASR